MGILTKEIIEITSHLADRQPQISAYFLGRSNDGHLTRDENAASHFCVYFLPYNPETQEFFIVHHKKSGLWLAPGGHIDKGESILQTLNREIAEELGVNDFFPDRPRAFLISITPIENKAQICKEHLDIWFLMETDGRNFNVDPREFHETRWLSREAARSLITDKNNLEALEII